MGTQLFFKLILAFPDHEVSDSVNSLLPGYLHALQLSFLEHMRVKYQSLLSL